ncbi:MAG: hypothetical protein ACXQTR_03380 [Candidatus Methanospirareceae archaeon]
MELAGILGLIGVLVVLVVETRVQIAYIKGKLEVLEKKIENGFRRGDKNGS